MADITFTSSNIVRASGPSAYYKADEAVTAGLLLYESAPGLVKVAANTSAVLANVLGIALNPAARFQMVEVGLPGGVITSGAVLAAGTLYVLSAAGKISPPDDVVTGDWLTFIGWASATTALHFQPVVTGVQAAADIT